MAPTKTETKTPEDAERDVVEARADLAESLEEIEQRLKPDALIDQGVAYFRGDGRRYVDGLYRRAEANPLAVALIGIGVAWLALGPRSRRSNRPPEFERDPFDRVGHLEDMPRSPSSPVGAPPATGAAVSATASGGQSPGDRADDGLPEDRIDEESDPVAVDAPVPTAPDTSAASSPTPTARPIPEETGERSAAAGADDERPAREKGPIASAHSKT